MKDIQSLHDTRRIDIRKVGVKTITYPISVLDKEHAVQETIAKVNMYVNLPHEFKGTHMSRFIEILNQFHGKFNLERFHQILEEMKVRLEAEAAHLEIEFPYFLQSVAGSAAVGSERYECRMHGSLADELDLVMEVEVPVALPISLGESNDSTTGFWGTARIAVRMHTFLWIEDLIGLIKEATQEPPQNGDSVELICKRVSTLLKEHDAIKWYKVTVENLAGGYSSFASAEGPDSVS